MERVDAPLVTCASTPAVHTRRATGHTGLLPHVLATPAFPDVESLRARGFVAVPIRPREGEARRLPLRTEDVGLGDDAISRIALDGAGIQLT